MLSQYSLCGAPPTATRPGAASLPGRCPTVPRPGSLGLSGAAHLARTQTSSLHAQIVNSCRRAAWSAGRGLPERLCPSATPIHGLGRSRGQATRSSAFRGNRAGPGGFNANGGYGTGAAGMGPEELNGRFQQMEQQVFELKQRLVEAEVERVAAEKAKAGEAAERARLQARLRLERRLTLIGVSLLLLAVVAVAAWVELAAPPLGTASLDGSGLGRWLAPLLRWLRLA